MAAAKPPKTLLISQLIDQLKTAFANTPELPRLEFVESVIFAILRENRSTSEALATLARFKADYENDFNELRVSGTREIAQKIGAFPDAEHRARSIRKFLHQIFDRNYKFQIDGLNKKPFKEIRDELKDYEALGVDHHIALVQVQCLGGHAFPVDARLLEAARRLGIVDRNADAATLRGSLEKNIPKAQIHQAIALAERFVNDICTHDAPKCKECLFQKICPFALGLMQPAKSAPAEKTKPAAAAKPAAVAAKTPAAKPVAPAPAAKSAAAKPVAPKTAAEKPAAPEPAPAKPAPVKAAPAKTAAKPAPAKAETAKPVAPAPKPAAKPAAAAAAKPAAKPAPSPAPAKKPAEPAPAPAAAAKPKAARPVKAAPAPVKEAKATAPPAKPAAKPKAAAGETPQQGKPAPKKPAEKPAPVPAKKRKS